MTIQAVNATPHIDGKSWGLLTLLALIWGGSFMFVGVAVKELPALLIVLARVGIAAAILLPLHLIFEGPLPRDARTWISCGGMSIMNNVLPFTAISWGQHNIASGLASVINATTPMFAAIAMATFGFEAITLRKIIALSVGFIGVLVLKGGSFGELGPQTYGILAITFASFCYGFSSPWSKSRLMGIPPMTTATCQLTISTFLMAVLVMLFSEPHLYGQVSLKVWAALLGLAAFSTSVAYLIFFRIISRSGPSFVSLVTMLVPVSAIILGYFVLGETLNLHEALGAVLIGLALVIIDGRALKRLGLVKA